MGSNYRGRPMKKARPRKPSAENEKLHYNILFASPEVSPFAGTGGLGEVAGSLPKALKSIKSSDIDCRVIMPLYQSIADEYRQDMAARFAADRSIKDYAENIWYTKPIV